MTVTIAWLIDRRGSTTAILGAMGFNPHRKQKRRPSDVLFVAAGLLIALALVAWALFG